MVLNVRIGYSGELVGKCDPLLEAKFGILSREGSETSKSSFLSFHSQGQLYSGAGG